MRWFLIIIASSVLSFQISVPVSNSSCLPVSLRLPRAVKQTGVSNFKLWGLFSGIQWTAQSRRVEVFLVETVPNLSIIAALIPKERRRYCFHRFLSVHISGGGYPHLANRWHPFLSNGGYPILPDGELGVHHPRSGQGGTPIPGQDGWGTPYKVRMLGTPIQDQGGSGSGCSRWRTFLFLRCVHNCAF